MRRGTMLVLGLLLASTAMPPAAEARPLLLKILRGMTAPLGAISGAGRHTSRRAYHPRRATASRTRPAAVAAATAAATTGAIAATAANGATTPSSASADLTPSQRNAEQDTQSQRNAALAPATETDGRGSELGRETAPIPVQFHFGTVGPSAWPTAYEDVIGFTFWPKEYGGRLRVHGIGDVLSTALTPSASLAARTQPNNVRQARADEPGNPPLATPGCGSVDLTAADWPVAQIAGAMDLSDEQRAALDQLRTALSDGIASIKSACRDDANFTPVERLRAMQNALWAVHDSAQLIRAPLAKFYGLLTDEQRKQFVAPASPQTDVRAMSRGDMARICDLPASTDSAMRQIDQGLRPTKAQRASLDAFQKKSSEMGQFLMASCLKPMPATPVERLDAAADRLTAVIFAVSNVNMALNDFTSQLSDDQKSKLNSLVR